jgi:hypothetical protein
MFLNIMENAEEGKLLSIKINNKKLPQPAKIEINRCKLQRS